MKKVAGLMAFLVLSLMMTVTAMAAPETDPDIVLEAEQNGSVVVADIITNGKATDGVLEITYDASVLSAKRAEETAQADADEVIYHVDIADVVDMYSVHVFVDESGTETGVIKISWLSQEAIPEGTYITVQFQAKTTADDLAESVTGFTGEAYSGQVVEGESLQVGMRSEETTEPETKPQDKPEDKPGQSSKPENNQGQAGGSPTGDESNPMLWITVMMAAVLVCGGLIVFRVRNARYEEGGVR